MKSKALFGELTFTNIKLSKRSKGFYKHSQKLKKNTQNQRDQRRSQQRSLRKRARRKSKKIKSTWD